MLYHVLSVFPADLVIIHIFEVELENVWELDFQLLSVSF